MNRDRTMSGYYKIEEDEDLKLFIEYLETLAVDLPYLDPDFRIVVLESSTVPFIVMSPEVFEKLERRIIGDG
jgi:hypothetical protein